jgi:phosphoribosylglycinamide formyltransferase 1
MKRLVIFASGSGTNADNICSYFANHNDIKVAALFCNKAKAGVLLKMVKYDIPTETFDKEQLANEDFFSAKLSSYEPDIIVLAGFLWLIPQYLISQYPNKIINIHPALLPKYGGKGMYGEHIHKAVLANKEKEHGITIHLVNEKYDEGKHLFRHTFAIGENETLQALKQKIAAAEMKYFPEVIRDYVQAIEP